jgi:ribonuclease-3
MVEKIVKNFEDLQKEIQIYFKDKNLLISAFCHRSFLNEFKNFNLPHNERLEFLGDSILNMIVAEHLYKNFPDVSEGELSNLRACLINRQILAEVAKKLNFEKYLLLSKGEQKSVGRGRETILANTFEAFLGALYLDQGYKICQDFLEKHLLIYIPKILKENLIKSAKTIFQEKAQEIVGITPTYKVLKEWGPDHDKRFLVGVFLGDELVAEGEGSSKQEAGEEAAKKALKVKKWI